MDSLLDADSWKCVICNCQSSVTECPEEGPCSHVLFRGTDVTAKIWPSLHGNRWETAHLPLPQANILP